MNYTKKALALLALLIGVASTALGQTALTQTTLGAAVNGYMGYSGITKPLDTSVTLASVTGVTGATLGTQPNTILYVDKEAMGVISVNTTTKIAQVIRGYMSTQANPHANGTMVLIGNPGGTATPSAAGGVLGPQFYEYNPSGACTAASTPSTPWINVTTGEQWLCSSVTGTWGPGWGNPGTSAVPMVVQAAVASAAGQITPSGPLFHITGAAAITGFLIPVGFNATAAGGGSFCVIPDGAFTTTTANNIAIASTAVVNRQLCYLWDATNSKFVPSY